MLPSTAKNKIVSDFYASLGFEKQSETESGTFWKYDIPADYSPMNHVISVQ